MTYIDAKMVDVHGRPIRVGDLVCLVGDGFSFGSVIGFMGKKLVVKGSDFIQDCGKLNGLCDPDLPLIRIGTLNGGTPEYEAFHLLAEALAEQSRVS